MSFLALEKPSFAWSEPLVKVLVVSLLASAFLEVGLHLIPQLLGAKSKTWSLQLLHQRLTVWISEKRWAPVWRDGAILNNYHTINSPDHFQELSDHSNLSQRAVYADLFGFKYSLHRYDANEEKVARTRLFKRALNGQSKQLDLILQNAKPHLDKLMQVGLGTGTAVGDRIAVKNPEMMRELAGTLMAELLVGKTLTEEPELRKALRQHPKTIINFTKVYQVTPGFMGPFLWGLISRKSKAMRTLLARLEPICEGKEDAWAAPQQEKDTCILGWMIELSAGNEYWTPTRIVQALVGIWFAASHQPWTMAHFLLCELCKRPEYIESIRKELSAEDDYDYETLDRFPILNSFMKETLRYNPTDKLNVRRKALRPMQFSNDGPKVEAGDIACLPQYKMMTQSPRWGKDGRVFDGMRFARNAPEMWEEDDPANKLTEVAQDFTLWGFGSLACPGRFQANFVMKLILAHIIQNYDFELEDDTLPLSWTWMTFQVPYESTRILYKRRA